MKRFVILLCAFAVFLTSGAAWAEQYNRNPEVRAVLIEAGAEVNADAAERERAGKSITVEGRTAAVQGTIAIFDSDGVILMKECRILR